MGMDQVLPGCLFPGKASGRQAVHRLKFRRPGIEAGLEVPIKCADLRHLLSQPQPFLTLPYGLLGRLARGYVPRGP